MNKSIMTLALSSILCCNSLLAETLVVDDSFKDGGRNNGSDKNDSDWWTSSSKKGIEVSSGSLGLVSGSSGRGIRTTFESQKLSLGDTIRATITFTTPATIGADRSSAFRIGLYDVNEELEADLIASSTAPNSLYDDLQGYMINFDVNLSNLEKTNIEIAKKSNAKVGRLLGSIKNHNSIAKGGSLYWFLPNTTYTAVMSLTHLSNGIHITGGLFEKGNKLSYFSSLSKNSNVDSVGMLALHVNSKTFGSKDENTGDNGIDIKNVRVTVTP